MTPQTNVVTNGFRGNRFEAQIAAVKERLEAAKAGSTRGLASHADGPEGFGFMGTGSRIAKPLRGGGAFDGLGINGVGLGVPTVSALQAQEAAEGRGKRSSWFFDRR